MEGDILAYNLVQLNYGIGYYITMKMNKLLICPIYMNLEVIMLSGKKKKSICCMTPLHKILGNAN